MSQTRPLLFALLACASVNAQTPACRASGDNEDGCIDHNAESVDEFRVSLLQKQIEVQSADGRYHKIHFADAHTIKFAAMGVAERLGNDPSAIVMFYLISGCMLACCLTFIYTFVVMAAEPGSRKSSKQSVDQALSNKQNMRMSLMEVMRPDGGAGGAGGIGIVLPEGPSLADVEVLEPENVDEDLYGHAVATICRDIFAIAGGEGSRAIRYSRLGLAVLLLFLSLTIQLGLLFGVKWYIADTSVVDLRQTYDLYENTMYGNKDGENPDHVRTIIGGQVRGIPEHFDESGFDHLTIRVKHNVCNIPFSQPGYLCAILFIWSLTCVAEIKRAVDMLNLFVRVLPTVPLHEMFEARQDDDPDQHNLRVILGVPLPVKLLIVEAVILPRILLSGYLMWLGCRWLAATPNLTDVLANAVALEFVLLLKELLYHTLVTNRNKREMANTKIRIPNAVEHAGYVSFLGTMIWALVALVWVIYYVFHFQMVLQEYNWDVQGPCTEYMNDAHDLTAGGEAVGGGGGGGGKR